MTINPKHLKMTISSSGCGFPNEKCYCCQKFGYHSIKFTHKPTGISAECSQIIREILPPPGNTVEDCIRLLEDPKELAMNDLQRKLNETS